MDTLTIEGIGITPYLRDAAVCLIPRLTDQQLGLIEVELQHFLSRFVLVRRLTENTVLAEGIPIHARSAHDAESLAWEIMAYHVRRALDRPEDVSTRITSIDVRETIGALA